MFPFHMYSVLWTDKTLKSPNWPHTFDWIGGGDGVKVFEVYLD